MALQGAAIETKERILDAAEKLFGNSGFSATSLRDITAEAGVNLASVNYHFGSKEALLGKVFERRFAPVNQQRLERLSEVEALQDTRPLQVERIIRAFVSPPFERFIELGDSGRQFLRLAGRVHTESDEIRALLLKTMEPIIARFTTALQRALPEVAPSEVELRILLVVGAMAYTMTWGNFILAQPGAGRTPDDLLESLVKFATAGMVAPSPEHAGVLAQTLRRSQ